MSPASYRTAPPRVAASTLTRPHGLPRGPGTRQRRTCRYGACGAARAALRGSCWAGRAGRRQPPAATAASIAFCSCASACAAATRSFLAYAACRSLSALSASERAFFSAALVAGFVVVDPPPPVLPVPPPPVPPWPSDTLLSPAFAPELPPKRVFRAPSRVF